MQYAVSIFDICNKFLFLNNGLFAQATKYFGFGQITGLIV